jgi:hypothetical protein
MRMPWDGKSGLAKATAFLATLLLVSLGLCGANFVGVIFLAPLGGGGDTSPWWRNWSAYVLFPAAYIELAGIAIGIVGLIVVAIIAITRKSSPGSDAPSDREKS